jgi:hypothetical protein
VDYMKYIMEKGQVNLSIGWPGNTTAKWGCMHGCWDSRGTERCKHYSSSIMEHLDEPSFRNMCKDRIHRWVKVFDK